MTSQAVYSDITFVRCDISGAASRMSMKSKLQTDGKTDMLSAVDTASSRSFPGRSPSTLEYEFNDGQVDCLQDGAQTMYPK